MIDSEHSAKTLLSDSRFWLLIVATLVSVSGLRADGESSKKDSAPDNPKNPAFAAIQEDPNLPRILLIGDSISIGYTVPVRELLKDKANVLRIPVNGGPTTRGLEMLDSWIAGQKWDVIHFNWGLHDIKRLKNGKMDTLGDWQVDAAAYRKNLKSLVLRLKQTGAQLIWASTTPVPEGAGGRIRGDEVKANAIAEKMMKKKGVAVDDLYSFIFPHLEQYQQPRNVHFTPEGYAYLAKQVAARILDELESLPQKNAEPSNVTRLATNPIIRPEMLPEGDGKNINGPSLIRVPDWLPKPLGKYYLYFADHGGKYIRLAYSDDVTGPWKVYEPGTLHLEQVPDGKGHIASPDVHVDHEQKDLRMYFHCPSRSTGRQTTYLARSTDGIHFKAGKEPFGAFYFRVFRFDGYWYAMAKRGWLYRSKDGVSAFDEGPNPFLGITEQDGEKNSSGIRHVAVDLVGNTLNVYFTNIGDSPERVLRSNIELTPDWTQWKASPPELVLKPETEYEGADLPLAKSNSGKAKGRENAVRDPAIFRDEGHTYLLYSTAGESGIGIAELVSRVR